MSKRNSNVIIIKLRQLRVCLRINSTDNYRIVTKKKKTPSEFYYIRYYCLRCTGTAH